MPAPAPDAGERISVAAAGRRWIAPAAVTGTAGQGPTATVPADARQLFLSLLSATTGATLSAQASKKYVPGAVLVGIVTVTVPVDVSPGSNAGTARLPVRRLSPVLRSSSNDR